MNRRRRCQLELGRLLEGNNGGLCASQYLRYLSSGLAEAIRDVGAVRDKSSRFGISGASVFAWQAGGRNGGDYLPSIGL